MRNIIKLLMATLVMALFTNCYDRDVLDSKDFNYSLPDVENLDYVKQGSDVKLTWQMPDNISPDFKRPLEVSIQVVENDVYRQKVIVGAESASAEIAIDASKKYRFVVKLLGYLTDEVRDKGKSDRAYSEGKIVEVQ